MEKKFPESRAGGSKILSRKLQKLELQAPLVCIVFFGKIPRSTCNFLAFYQRQVVEFVVKKADGLLIYAIILAVFCGNVGFITVSYCTYCTAMPNFGTVTRVLPSSCVLKNVSTNLAKFFSLYRAII